jgi:hypothetical protein
VPDECSGASQTVFGPHGTRLFVAGKFAARGGGFRGGDSGAFVNRERDRRFVIRPGQTQHGAGDVVLLLRRQIAHGSECIIEKICHGRSVARHDWKTNRNGWKARIVSCAGSCFMVSC